MNVNQSSASYQLSIPLNIIFKAAFFICSIPLVAVEIHLNWWLVVCVFSSRLFSTQISFGRKKNCRKSVEFENCETENKDIVSTFSILCRHYPGNGLSHDCWFEDYESFHRDCEVLLFLHRKTQSIFLPQAFPDNYKTHKKKKGK